ncbi:FAD-dependent oxidoreductase [Paenibacillus sp. Y412MC10]|uniref:phytoene desaturase family protein n=1 Tax=Geobacillus sp. (strain Y412MC10) TaxID=481743 RepID=UPI0028CBB3BD|nr:FAD-dependent oxidoreductase [Paenibacillus sp. Y412MC10]
MTRKHPFYDIAVIGGGLTGLTAAIYAARSGRSVILLEKDSRLGGLAQTARIGGALFNYGPRAMYEGSAALRILDELGCKPSLGSGTKNAMHGILDGKLIHATEELNPEEQTEWSTLMGSLNRIDQEPVRSISIKEWALGHVRSDRVRQFFYAMCRQWAYDDDMERLSAGYVLEQGQLAGQGVRYVLGGWQKVIDSLQREAVRAGVVIAAGAEAAQIMHDQGAVTGILLSEGTLLRAGSIIAAAGPHAVSKWLKGSGLHSRSLEVWKEQAHPLYVSCLDVSLKQVPHPDRAFVLGLDEPFYYSNHSAAIPLTEDGSQVIHVMTYHGSMPSRDPKLVLGRMKERLEAIQPGWDREASAVRYSPNLLAAHASRPALRSGDAPATGPAVPEIRGLYVAGDWVGREGRLADTAMTSAKLAGLTAAGID